MADLTLGEQLEFARLFGKPILRSDNLRPVNITVNTIDQEMVDSAVRAAQEYRASHPTSQSRNTNDLVLSILEAALEHLNRGQQKDRQPTSR